MQDRKKQKTQKKGNRRRADGRRNSALSVLFCFSALFFLLLFGGISYGAPETTEASAKEDGSSAGESGASREGDISVQISEVAAQEGIDLKLSYGYQNTAKSGKGLPVTISIVNHTEQEISGNLELSAKEESGAELCYVYEAIVPAGDRQELRESLSLPAQAETVLLRLSDSKGSLLAEKEIPLSIQGNEDELLIGLLSDTPYALSWLRGVTLLGTPLRTRTVTLNPADFPSAKEGLSQLGVLVISGYAMNRLTEEMAQVIYGFVEDGGALLIGTGDTRNPLGNFAEYLPEAEIGLPETRSVDMGLRYSSDSPDGAQIELPVSSIFLPDGMQTMQSGDLAVLTTVARGSGVIGLCAYDLCDVEDFAVEESAYADELLQALLSSSRIQELSARGAGEETEYEAVSELLSAPDTARFPNLGIYFCIAAVYLLLAGPGLFMLLRQNGLSLYYPFGVVLMSAVFAVLLWLFGLGTRFAGPVAQYAVIRERSGERESETAFLKLSSPDQTPLFLTANKIVQIRPILPDPTREADPENGFAGVLGTAQAEAGTMLRSGRVTIGAASEENYIETEGFEPFFGRLFSVSRSGEAEEAPALQTDLHFFDGKVSGSIENTGTEDLKDLALLLYGRILRIGDLKAGESRTLSSEEAVLGPAGAGALTAAYVTGADAPGDEGSGERIRMEARTGLLSRYLEGTAINYDAGARIVAFSEKEHEPLGFAQMKGAYWYGTGLYVQTVEADLSEDGALYRSALSAEPKILSGVYRTADNTISGTAPVVLEYALGGDLLVQSLELAPLSEAFSGKKDEAGNTLIPFRGNRAFYNYMTSSYDMLSSSRTKWSAAEIAPYLSPSNTITVRYIPDENVTADSLMFLPQPSVTGLLK